MKIRLLFFLLFGIFSSLCAQEGNVYLVLGSDTGMWEGLNTSDYNCYIKGDLYTVPTRNGYRVMDDAFRNSLKDSYGGIMKLTWWMMSGNMFYYSVNANTPNPNSMAPYLMKKYHGAKIAQFGDELTLHYHTFFWSNYNGTYYWNQAMFFNDSRADFDFTMAQNLLDENLFPVSFRSGWHFMDNDWQNYLDKLLPFSLHNDYPSKKTVDTDGERDNVIDWSLAPSTWVPYHPSSDNYQLPGSLKGWDTRSKHIGSISQKEMDSIFARASRGIDQVPCLWGHLPEEDFLQNLKRVDSLAHQSAKKFPLAKFRYCTAVEAMQRWLKTTDSASPFLQVTEKEENGKIAYDITTDEEIFQAQPFFAVKDIYERYTILNCQKTGQNTWRTEYTDRGILAKAGAAVTDLSGNLSTKLINYLPDDMFVDNENSNFVKPVTGTWTKVTDHSCFDISYLGSTVDTSAAGSSLLLKGPIPRPGKYNVFVQFADAGKAVDSLQVLFGRGGVVSDTIIFKGQIKPRSWLYLSTVTVTDMTPLEIKISSGGKSQSGKIIAFDALKFTPLIREKEIFIRADFADLGDVIAEKETEYTVKIENRGTGTLQINSLSTANGLLSFSSGVPINIGAMGAFNLPVKITPKKPGPFADTLVIASNDPVHPFIRLTIKGNGTNYYFLIDNDEPLNYKETGVWAYSNSNGFGSSSRYASLNQKPGARAEFRKVPEKSGTYDFMHYFPVNVNSTNHALYILSSGTTLRDSFYIAQDAGSGNWVKLATRYLQAGSEVKVEIIDAGGNTNPQGAVLRADAVRFNLITTTGLEDDGSKQLPGDFALLQNYPNPFNPSTVIPYSLARASEVTLKVYDILGGEILTLFSGNQMAGRYSLRFDAGSAGRLSSGVYFCVLKAVPSDGGRPYVRTMKMMLVK